MQVSVETTNGLERRMKVRPAGIAAHRYGIHFLDLKPEALKAIEAYLNSAARKKRPAIY